MLKMSKEVAAALADGAPVVALESTIISHGMPYPRNIETANAVEAAVREAGAVPATIAIIAGAIKIGLTASELTLLGQPNSKVEKCSRRDLPFAVSRQLHGATTVAATMIVAAQAGIPVFATGGIGGVHRDVEHSLDISADLQEMARTNVAVVCAGVKSILDIPRTLEYLETHGVPVVGYQTDLLPAFYCRDSDCIVDYRVESATEVAHAMRAKWDLKLDGGLLVGVPIPAEHALDRAAMDATIEHALAEMQAQGIQGKATTPFLLEHIMTRTGGRSLDANVQLILNNARVAAEIAIAFAAG